MSDKTAFTLFKKDLMSALNRMLKNHPEIISHRVIIDKKQLGFEVTIFCGRPESLDLANVARIIYEHKPVFALCYGTIGVDVKNSLGRVNHIKFTVRQDND